MAKKVERKSPVKGDAWRTPRLLWPSQSSSRPVTLNSRSSTRLRLHGNEATYAYHDHGRAAAPGRVASPTMRPGARSSTRSALARARSGDGRGPKAALC
jgi:hypothetical protein